MGHPRGLQQTLNSQNILLYEGNLWNTHSKHYFKYKKRKSKQSLEAWFSTYEELASTINLSPPPPPRWHRLLSVLRQWFICCCLFIVNCCSHCLWEFCVLFCALLCVLSPVSFAIIHPRKRELVAWLLLPSECYVAVIVLCRLLLTVPWAGLWCVIVVHVFPGHIHPLFGCKALRRKRNLDRARQTKRCARPYLLCIIHPYCSSK